MVVISSLIFALIIFNSYSAFITSILSVEVSNIKSIDDLLASDYHLGYIKNSQDDVYLQVINIHPLTSYSFMAEGSGLFYSL